MLANVLFAMGVGRILLGLFPFLGIGWGMRLLGFPAAHDSATARLMARLFGVRDIGLGVLVFFAVAHPEWLAAMCLFQAATDFGDGIAIAIPLVRREGIDRAAWSSLAFALPAGLAWLTAYFTI